jgi:hypothetical protein
LAAAPFFCLPESLCFGGISGKNTAFPAFLALSLASGGPFPYIAAPQDGCGRQTPL